jgi:hypothetical protein
MGPEPGTTWRALTDDLLLLAAGARRRRLRIAVRAAGHADRHRTTLRAASRSLVARGLASRVGWRDWAPSPDADIDALQSHVSRVLWRPREATDRDRDLIAVVLAAGALPGRQRMHARTLLARVDAAAAPPAIAWLLKCYGLSTTAELADRFLRATAPSQRFEDGAFDPGESSGIWLA